MKSSRSSNQAARSQPGASADQAGCRLLSCTFRQRLRVSGSGVGGCEPPAPGSWVGLSQSECYCKVSGFAGRILLPLHPPPAVLAFGISSHSTLLFPFEYLYLWEVPTPAPTSPQPPPSLLPPALAQHPSAGYHPQPPLSPTPWVPVGQ